MRLAEPLQASWQAHLALEFEARSGRSVLARNRADGPLVVQKLLYPEGPQPCQAIIVHPPGGIAGGDQLSLDVQVREQAAALLTTPGAAKWYRSGGPLARQSLRFEIEGCLEWLPRETIVFDGALAALDCEIRLGPRARYIGWELCCLGRTGSGERFTRGRLSISTQVVRGAIPVWYERGELHAESPLMRSPVGLGGHSVFGVMLATHVPAELVAECRNFAATTLLPGLMVARYVGDSTAEALDAFTRVWRVVRPAVVGREAAPPRIWST